MPKANKASRQSLSTSTMEGAQPPDKESNMPVSPEILAICKLIGTMKITVHELQNLLKLLGNGMEQVAELAPAVKASEEIKKIRAMLERRIKLHEDETNDLRKKLRKRVEDVIRTKFYDEAKSAMKDAVQRKVSDKVGRLLTERIPDELRVQGHGHRRQILEIQTNLHNTCDV
ncbi:hypothetical protein L218DRAFT_524203 [Marasmius fiardii PR-910]|nr:hypothetical protein L218DRAFT_524203 [Marasmius fiardii PR-910]